MKFIISELERQKILNSHNKINQPGILIEDTTTNYEITLSPTIGTANFGKQTQTITTIPKGSKLVKDGKKINIIVKDSLGGWTYYCGSKPQTFVMNSSLKSYNGAYYSEIGLFLSNWMEENLCKETKEEPKQDIKLTGTVGVTEKPPQKTAKEVYDEQCSLDCNKRWPYYSVVCDGSNWKQTLNSWISEKGGGKDKKTYRSLRTSWCSGWRPGQTQEKLMDFIVPIFPGSETTTTTVLPDQNQQISVY